MGSAKSVFIIPSGRRGRGKKKVDIRCRSVGNLVGDLNASKIEMSANDPVAHPKNSDIKKIKQQARGSKRTMSMPLFRATPTLVDCAPRSMPTTLILEGEYQGGRGRAEVEVIGGSDRRKREIGGRGENE